MSAYTVSSPDDLVVIVPHILGYTPDDSLVLVTGTRTAGRGEVGLTLRFDFDFTTATNLSLGALRSIVDAVRHADDAVTVFPILYSSEIADALGLVDDEPKPLLLDHFMRPVTMICSLLADAGYRVMDPRWAGAGMCGSLMDLGEVRELVRVRSSEANVRMIADGLSHAEDFAAATTPPPADPDLLADVAHVRSRRLNGTISDAELFDAALADLLDLRRLAGDASVEGDAAPGPADDDRAAELDRSIQEVLTAAGVVGIEAMVERLWGRDSLTMVLGFDHPHLRPLRLRNLEPLTFIDFAEVVGRSDYSTALMIGLSPERPDFERTRCSVRYLGLLVNAVDAEHRAPVLAILAWFEWARARNSFAEAYALQALELDPEYSLAKLMCSTVDHGMQPRWMLTR